MIATLHLRRPIPVRVAAVRPCPTHRTRALGPALLLASLALVGLLAAGCGGRIKAYPPGQRPIVDRRFVEYPTGTELRTVAENFTAASALAIGPDGMVYVADRGMRNEEARITRIDPETGKLAEIYPVRSDVLSGYFERGLKLYGPVGGLAVVGQELIVTARDRDDHGIVVAFDLSNWRSHRPDRPPEERPPMRTVVGELPAQGDHGVTDIAVHPVSGRLFFGVGSATNAGVVGVDNWQSGWLREHRRFHDLPLVDLKIGGYRFDTEDPFAGPLNPDKVNTAPFNPFRGSDQRISAADGGKPTAAIYSVDPLGGDLRVEAHGLRNPRGLAFNEYANLYATNQGMELRGTRPVKDDPDVLIRVPLSASLAVPMPMPPAATWYGWPDYSADLMPITDARFQPPRALLARTGYEELSPLIETPLPIADRETLLAASFASLSGAAGLAFVPDGAPALEAYEGLLVVALHGDRAPFATSGLPLVEPVGYKLVVVDPNRRSVQEFIYNVGPRNQREPAMLDRPVDVAFAPDGSMYLLDTGRMTLRNGRERYKPRTGRLYRLSALDEPPATTQSVEDDDAGR